MFADAIVSEDNATVVRGERGRFIVPPVSPGRPKGSKNKLQEDFLSDVLEAWQSKGKQAIDDMIAEKPGDFVKMVAGLMPKEATLTINDNSELTDEQLAERIRQLGQAIAPFLLDGTGATPTGDDGEECPALIAGVH